MHGPLLAKSRHDRNITPFEITLVGHTACVLRAVEALFGQAGAASTRLALSWLRFFRLSRRISPNFSVIFGWLPHA